MFPELFIIKVKPFLFCYILKIPRIFTKEEVSVAEIDKLNSY